MSSLQAAMIGFEITPGLHPTCGAWGCNPATTAVDLPLLSRCLVLSQDDRPLVWFSLDLVGESPEVTDARRDEIAEALDLTRDQVLWTTDQNHSSGALPRSLFTGCVYHDLSKQDADFMKAEDKRLMSSAIEAAREGISRLQPASLRAGRGYCATASFNTRSVLPNGRFKFVRHHAEAALSGQPIDPTIGLVRFDDVKGRAIGVIFNFAAHPATILNGKVISSDYVGWARQGIEQAIGGAPAMFCQGFCSDINCYHMFGTVDDARRTGQRLGRAAVEGLSTLIPARSEPFDFAYKTIELQCQPILWREDYQKDLAAMQKFLDELQTDPYLCWCCGMNLPLQVAPEQRVQIIQTKMAHRQAGLRILESGKLPPSSVPIRLGAVRIGDVGMFLSPGENFVQIGLDIRARSPFVHTLLCGETCGLFGNIGTDAAIDQGGYGTDSYYEVLQFADFRLPPAKGSAGRIIDTAVELLNVLWKKGP